MSSENLPLNVTKTNVLGIGVSRTNYIECTELIIASAKQHQSCTVAATNVHSITTGYLDLFLQMINLLPTNHDRA